LWKLNASSQSPIETLSSKYFWVPAEGAHSADAAAFIRRMNSSGSGNSCAWLGWMAQQPVSSAWGRLPGPALRFPDGRAVVLYDVPD